MDPSFIDLIGYLAAICTTIAFFPQAYKIWKTKSARDISLWMFSVLTTGIFFWLLYGLFLNSYPIILANTFTLILCISILYFKMIY